MDTYIDILNFDDTYKQEDYYKKVEFTWIDLSDMRNVNRYCERESLLKLYTRIKNKKRTNMTFIGNGNYHYVTYLLLKDIKQPFTLVLFDNHTDMMKPPCSDIISCGSWVRASLNNLTNLKKVVVIGPDEELTKTAEEFDRNRVVFFTKQDIDSRKDILSFLSREIITDKVYVSIDKDILSPEEVKTNWDQGSMKLKDLVMIVDKLQRKKEVFGVDVCGEYEADPCSCFTNESVKAFEMNNEANNILLKEIEKVVAGDE